MRLVAAMLYVKDLQRMTAFYGNILRLQPVTATRRDDWVEFETGTARLALHAIPQPLAAQIEVASPPSPREETPLKLMFGVADVATETSRLTSLGVPLIHRPWGGWDGVDPEGNIFSILEEKHER